ncbi:VPLPA-CTERM sorting domain-containing protein [Jannaschia seohaensis]|uniref:Putative secreted protein n=1 Tax=Jannaschia seohaensis TaxID=475081 RepID=A0A2Y9C3T6_9RHOB|nr:VPLPA-CTERM sorting domain-containing protein [Jannaschia seohaensis]PWJ22095.1 putative secreted protein [Jannaschia seohaensis]SSA38373.1 VPLPA-CTERM protein sorting domain-containing protein [Jannaschia seohaensis]
MRSLLAAAALFALSGAANATTMEMSLVEDGANVTFSFAGTIDTTDFLASGRASAGNEFFANPSAADIGSTAGPFERFNIAIFGPAFGTGGTTSILGVGFGDSFLIDGSNDSIVLTESYVSGASLSGGALLTGQSLASLGASEGEYVYTFGNNTATLNVSIALVPLPAGAVLLMGALGGLTLLRRRKG